VCVCVCPGCVLGMAFNKAGVPRAPNVQDKIRGLRLCVEQSEVAPCPASLKQERCVYI
jgi:hypothetical protein